jgi:diguanylate cyclase (GGDEF)-like protein
LSASCIPAVTLREAETIAERLRSAVAAAPFETLSGPVPVTVSIGVAEFGEGDSLIRLLERADAAMYAAKQAGRDRVATHAPKAG